MKRLIVLSSVFFFLQLSGCVPPETVTRTDTPFTINYSLPSLEPVATTNLQEKNSVGISCTVNQFEAVRQTKATYRKLDPGFQAIRTNDEWPVEETIKPYCEISPGNVTFN